MNLYITMKRGVYVQGLVGIFDTLELATKAAENAALTEYDGYHTYFVIQVELNKVRDVGDSYWSYYNFALPDPVFEAPKKIVSE